MKWIQIKGNFFDLERNILKYNPIPGIPEELDIHDAKIRTDYVGRVKCSDYFEGGVINFKVNLGDDSNSLVIVYISNNKISFSLNSGNVAKAFSISANTGTAAQAIDKESLKTNYEYDIQIEVNGANAKLFVDGIQICSANLGNVVRSQVEIGVRSRSNVTIKDFKLIIKNPKVFVVMQFSDEYNQLYSQVVKPVCEAFGYECLRGDEYFTTGSILKDIIDAINESAIVIADITPNNANVFYEVGYSHALRKPTILLSDKKRDKLPFDVSGFRTLFYDNTIAGKTEVEERLRKHLENIQTGN